MTVRHDAACMLLYDGDGRVSGVRHMHPPHTGCRLDPVLAAAAAGTPLPAASGPVPPPEGPPLDPDHPPTPRDAPTMPGTGTPGAARDGNGDSPGPDEPRTVPAE